MTGKVSDEAAARLRRKIRALYFSIFLRATATDTEAPILLRATCSPRSYNTQVAAHLLFCTDIFPATWRLWTNSRSRQAHRRRVRAAEEHEKLRRLWQTGGRRTRAGEKFCKGGSLAGNRKTHGAVFARSFRKPYRGARMAPRPPRLPQCPNPPTPP